MSDTVTQTPDETAAMAWWRGLTDQRRAWWTYQAMCQTSNDGHQPARCLVRIQALACRFHVVERVGCSGPAKLGAQVREHGACVHGRHADPWHRGVDGWCGVHRIHDRPSAFLS